MTSSGLETLNWAFVSARAGGGHIMHDNVSLFLSAPLDVVVAIGISAVLAYNTIRNRICARAHSKRMLTYFYSSRRRCLLEEPPAFLREAVFQDA